MCDRCLAKDDLPPRETKADLPAVQRRRERRETLETVLYGDRASLALSMRTDYAPWAEIAEVCGYVNEQTAFLAVKALMAKRQVTLDEQVDHVRIRELERLERMAAEAQKVMATPHYLVSAGKVVKHGPEGDERELLDDGPTLAAIDRLVKISDARRKLLGLDAPEKVKNEVTLHYTVSGIAESEMP